MCQVTVKRPGHKAKTVDVPTPGAFTGEISGFQPSKIPAIPAPRPIILGFSRNRTSGRAKIRCY